MTTTNTGFAERNQAWADGIRAAGLAPTLSDSMAIITTLGQEFGAQLSESDVLGMANEARTIAARPAGSTPRQIADYRQGYFEGFATAAFPAETSLAWSPEYEAGRYAGRQDGILCPRMTSAQREDAIQSGIVHTLPTVAA